MVEIFLEKVEELLDIGHVNVMILIKADEEKLLVLIG